MNEDVAPMMFREAVKGVLLICSLLLIWFLMSQTLSSGSLAAVVLVSILIGTAFGFAGARAEIGRPLLMLGKFWWWSLVAIFVGSAALFDTEHDMFQGGAMAATTLLTAIVAFAIFHLRMTRPR